jgi:hydrogenase expression/formation protein HypE
MSYFVTFCYRKIRDFNDFGDRISRDYDRRRRAKVAIASFSFSSIADIQQIYMMSTVFCRKVCARSSCFPQASKSSTLKTISRPAHQGSPSHTIMLESTVPSASTIKDSQFSSSFPFHRHPRVRLEHGQGGKLGQQLIEQMFLPAFAPPGQHLPIPHDSAAIAVPHPQLAFSTDSYLMRPFFFPGGNIGAISVYSTINNLSMSGACPLYLSAGFILEEGFSTKTLGRIVQAMRQASLQSKVQIVTGDTRVMPEGIIDGIIINTSGVGFLDRDLSISPLSVRPGDVILVNGDIGRHGTAMMAQEAGREWEGTIESDSAPFANLVLHLIKSGVEIHCLRDIARGGLAGILNAIAHSGKLTVQLEEKSIPLRKDVREACQHWGVDPLYLASGGRFLAIVPPSSVKLALEILRAHNPRSGAIGTVIGRSDRPTGLIKLQGDRGVRFLENPE